MTEKKPVLLWFYTFLESSKSIIRLSAYYDSICVHEIIIEKQRKDAYMKKFEKNWKSLK